MDIGKPIETIEVAEPGIETSLPEPIRRESPAELPDPTPAQTPEKVEV